MPVRSGPAVCVAARRFDVGTETFIRAHVAGLPYRVEVLDGPSFTCASQGANIGPWRVLQLLERACRHLAKVEWQPWTASAIARHLGGSQVAVVLAEYGPTGVKLMEACRRADVPLVVHFHGFDAYAHGMLARWGAAYRTMFRAAAAIIGVSRDMVAQLVNLGAPEDKLHWLPYGIDSTLFDAAGPAQAPACFLAVGRFAQKKAPHLTLRAFAKTREVCPEARLMMIGEGKLLPGCRRLAAEMGVAEAVEFAGAQGHDEVARRMRAARAFVQHSVRAADGDCEGTPVAVLEAQMAGLPVVGTRHAGIKDVVVEGQTGFLVDEHDVEGMARWMIELVRQPALAARLGEAGRARALAHFSLEQSLARLADILATASRGRLGS